VIYRIELVAIDRLRPSMRPGVACGSRGETARGLSCPYRCPSGRWCPADDRNSRSSRITAVCCRIDWTQDHHGLAVVDEQCAVGLRRAGQRRRRRVGAAVGDRHRTRSRRRATGGRARDRPRTAGSPSCGQPWALAAIRHDALWEARYRARRDAGPRHAHQRCARCSAACPAGSTTA
jgi:hypothetical protein